MAKFNQFKNEKTQAIYEDYLMECDSRWPIKSKEYYIETSYGSTFVRESGEGKVLILLPGTGCSSLAYDKVVKEFSQEFKIYAIDIIGDFGKSFLTKKINSPDDYAEWQKELFTNLNLKSGFSILGFSMGAWLGAMYSAKYKGVENLIMISPVSVVAKINIKATILGILPMILPFAKRYCIKKFFKDFYRTSSNANEVFEKRIYEPLKISRQCLKPIPPQVPKIFGPEKAKQISCNILYIVGENELLYNANDAVQYFHRYFSNGKSIVVPNTGHDLIEITPCYIVNKVIGFMKNQNKVL